MKTLLSFLLFVLINNTLIAQEISGSWIDLAHDNAEYILSQQGVILKLTRKGTKINYEGKIANGKIRLWYVFKTLDDVPARNTDGPIPSEIRNLLLNDSVTVSGIVKKNGSRISELKLTFNIPKYSQTGAKWIKNPSDVTLVKNPLQIINIQGDTLTWVTDISHPCPVISVAEFTAEQVKVENNTASIELSGTITDQLAEMVADDKARIKQITVEYIGLNVDNTASSVTQRLVTVQHSPLNDKTTWRPNPVKSEFKTTLNIPVWTGHITVSVRATNIIGNTGSDSFTLIFDGDLKVISIDHDDGTGPGLFNPVMISIYDPTVSAGQIPQVKLMNGKGIDMIKDDQNGNGAFRSKFPVIALAKPVNTGISNVIHALSSVAESKISYKSIGQEFYWSYTTHSPPNFYKYAGGTTVEHEVRSRFFEKEGYLVLNAAVEIQSLNPITNRWEKDNVSRGWVEKRIEKENGLDAGYIIKLELGKTNQETKKSIRFPIAALNGALQLLDQQNLGSFEVIPFLKTVIVGVDGLAYNAIEEALNDPRSTVLPAFKKVFKDGGSKNKALSAIPTITWCNWSGIFSGQPPARHGIMGNAFFERERDIEPFATPTAFGIAPPDVGGKLDNLGVTVGGLEYHAKKTPGGAIYSIYEDLARSILPPDSNLNILSVHQWYPRNNTSRVNYTPVYFTRAKHTLNSFRLTEEERFSLLTLAEHNAHAAKILDRLTIEEALHCFNGFGKHDVITVYFPGPDNVAHTIGDKTAFVEATGYQAGPMVPEDKKPLIAIRQHLQGFTDGQFQRLVDSIEASGYLYATLFALTGDHGLHAFHNTKPFNLTVNGGFDKFFKNLEYKLFKGEFFRKQDIVYAPNGGMAHIYIRSKDFTWQKPPLKKDIDNVACQLYSEATRTDGKYKNLSPKKNPAFIVRQGNRKDTLVDNGALGSPPAIFVKVHDNDTHNHFLSNFRWVKGVGTDRTVQYGTLDEFITARKQAQSNGRLLYPEFEWPEFKQRMEEMNDKNAAGSRTGDIVIFTDGYAGYLTINDGDELNGWHGGASESESYVPLFFNIPGNVVQEDFIQNAVTSVHDNIKSTEQREYLRNWDLGKILVKIQENFKPGN